MARFSKKHYEFLAAFLAYERSISNWCADTQRTATIDGLAKLLARRLEHDNPAFNRKRFLEACDVPEVL